jgi:hypothetical protein
VVDSVWTQEDVHFDWDSVRLGAKSKERLCSGKIPLTILLDDCGMQVGPLHS